MDSFPITNIFATFDNIFYEVPRDGKACYPKKEHDGLCLRQEGFYASSLWSSTMSTKYMTLTESDIELLSTATLSPDEDKLLEFAVVIDFFNKNPKHAKCKRGQLLHGINLTQSYLRDSEGVIVVVESGSLGRGAFGQVKDARSLVPGRGALAIKVVEIKDDEELEAIKIEAACNLDLGITHGPLIVRTNTERLELDPRQATATPAENEAMVDVSPDDDALSFGFEFVTDPIYPCKVYQVMENKGCSLQKKIIEARKHFDQEEKIGSTADRIAAPSKLKALEMDYAIKICILTQQLGAGLLSVTGTPYAHRDLKPDNFVVDRHGKIMVIDCGSMTSNVDVDEFAHFTFKGTPQYAAIDVAELKKGGLTALKIKEGIRGLYTQRDKSVVPVAPVLTNATLDRIAMLRTLWNPLDPCSENALAIFHRRTFESMPEVLRNVLDTTHIMPLVDVERRMETPAFFAALLIDYQENNTITAQRIAEIRESLVVQQQLIRNFEKKTAPVVAENLIAVPLSEEHINVVEVDDEKTRYVDLFKALREKVLKTRLELDERKIAIESSNDEMDLSQSLPGTSWTSEG